MIKKEFISDWTKEKVGLPVDAPLTRETLEAYQVKKLRETVAMAKKKQYVLRETVCFRGSGTGYYVN